MIKTVLLFILIQNSLWNEITDNLIGGWLKSCTSRPLKEDIQKARAKVFESVSNGTSLDAVRFALNKLTQGKPLGAWSSYLLEYGNTQPPQPKDTPTKAELEHRRDVIKTLMAAYKDDQHLYRQQEERLKEVEKQLEKVR